MKRILMLLLLAVSAIACGKDTPGVDSVANEKKVRVEVEFGGDYKNYQWFYSVTAMGSKEPMPYLSAPALPWTHSIEVGHNFDFVGMLTQNRYVIDTKEKSERYLFTFSVSQIETGKDAKPLTAIIKVFADDALIKTIPYNAAPYGQVSEPIQDRFQF